MPPDEAGTPQCASGNSASAQLTINEKRLPSPSPQLSWGSRGIWPSVDYAGVDDQTEVWWDATAEAPEWITIPDYQPLPPA